MHRYHCSKSRVLGIKFWITAICLFNPVKTFIDHTKQRKRSKHVIPASVAYTKQCLVLERSICRATASISAVSQLSSCASDNMLWYICLLEPNKHWNSSMSWFLNTVLSDFLFSDKMTIHGSARGHGQPRGTSISSYSSTGSGMEQTTPLLLEPTDFSGGSHSRSSSVREHRGTRGLESSKGLLPPTPGVIRGGSFREPGELRQKVEKYKNRVNSPQLRDSQPPGSSPDLLSVSYEDVSRGKPDANLRRVRSFKTTSKGVVNRGDSFRKKGARCGGLGKESPPRGLTPNVSPHLSATPRLAPAPVMDGDQNSSYYKIVALGAPGVGKTAITQQFMTSEYIAFDSSMGKFIFYYQSFWLFTFKSLRIIMLSWL